MEKQLIFSFIGKPQPVCFIHYHMMKCAGVKITNAIQHSKKFLNLINDGKIDQRILAQKGLIGMIDCSGWVRADYETTFNSSIKDASRKTPFLFLSRIRHSISSPIPFRVFALPIDYLHNLARTNFKVQVPNSIPVSAWSSQEQRRPAGRHQNRYSHLRQLYDPLFLKHQE